ncbi:WD40 domain-containing protein [Oryctes borbonicus]|uniref:WD40 domain-containing protein n=1 Tax=Oryctes borbonicus TaxID=1629725 RepID=A0A0T6BCR7_9SCAR|nr:WD40 domain-containing protein [Oryctes borbonicus]
MGSHSSRRMSDDDSRSSDNDSDSTDLHYAEIIQRLINRYRNGHLSAYTEEYEDTYSGCRVPKIKYTPCVAKLNESDFYFDTSLASGLVSSTRKPIGNNITTMLLNRERSMCSYDRFSRPNKTKISNWFLPNHMEKLDKHDGKVFCGTFSREGNYFITASQDQQIRIYKSDRGVYKLLKTIHARDVGWSIIDVAFSLNQEHFVYSTWSTALHLCSVDGDPEKQIPLCLVNTSRRFCIFSVAFSSDGREILGGANDGFLYIYDTQRNQRSLQIQAHDYDINSVAFADDSSHIIYSGGDDGLLKVWDRRMLGEERNANPVGVLAGHRDGITYVHPRGDSRYLISNSKDQSIKLWDVRVFSSQSAAQNTLRAVYEQTWDYRWQGVPAKLYSKEKLEGDTSIMTYRGHVVTRTLIRCRFSPVETTGQRYIYTGCGVGRLLIYDALTGKVVRELRKHSACVRDVSWHPYNNEILTSSWDKTIGHWYYSCNESDDKERQSAKISASEEKKQNPDVLRRSLRIALKRLRSEDSNSENLE